MAGTHRAATAPAPPWSPHSSWEPSGKRLQRMDRTGPTLPQGLYALRGWRKDSCQSCLGPGLEVEERGGGGEKAGPSCSSPWSLRPSARQGGSVLGSGCESR